MDGIEHTKLLAGLQALYDSEYVGFVQAGHGYSPHATREAIVTFNSYLHHARQLDLTIPDISLQLPNEKYESQIHHGELLGCIKTVFAHIDPRRIPRLADYQKAREEMNQSKYFPGDHKAAATPPLPKYDIFLSYTKSDSHIAEELQKEFEAADLTCFMAEKDVKAGADWSNIIRDALLKSNCIVLLITPRSVRKCWPLMETGAAWVLGKEIVPAIINVELTELAEPVSMHQARVIETIAQRKGLVSELRNLFLPDT